MNLDLDKRVVESYTSSSQKIRVLTEDWVNRELYCPNCGKEKLGKYSNNCPVADFFCQQCQEDFELKSKKNSVGEKIINGAYATMVKRLTSVNNPNFFLLSYDSSLFRVLNFFVIPKHYFVPDIIEKRKPLSSTARRSGWIGCNILLKRIPKSGRIFLVRNTCVEPKEKVLLAWKKTLFLREEKEFATKGWLLDMMRCIEMLGKDDFSLSDIYQYESSFTQQHPDNKHIKDKIRQQLQVLRDKGYLQFLERGRYRLV